MERGKKGREEREGEKATADFAPRKKIAPDGNAGQINKYIMCGILTFIGNISFVA